MMTWTRKTVSSCVFRLTLFVLVFGHCTSCNQGLRAYKDGDVMLGGLFSLHMTTYDKQWEVNPREFGRAEAVIFAINSVNKNVAFTFDSWYVTLVSCLTTLVTSFGLLGCMFGPKVYILLFRPQRNTVEHVRSQVWNFSFDSVAGTRGPPKPVNVGTPNPALEPENGRVCTSKL